MYTAQDQRKTLDLLKKAFLKSKFDFRKTGEFSFDIELEEGSIRNAHWKLNKADNIFIIQAIKGKKIDKALLMEITATKVDDKIFFDLSENLFKLEMHKDQN